MVYRVTIKISYCEAVFDFESGSNAVDFMKTAALHKSEECEKPLRLNLEIIKEEEECTEA